MFQMLDESTTTPISLPTVCSIVLVFVFGIRYAQRVVTLPASGYFILYFFFHSLRQTPCIDDDCTCANVLLLYCRVLWSQLYVCVFLLFLLFHFVFETHRNSGWNVSQKCTYSFWHCDQFIYVQTEVRVIERMRMRINSDNYRTKNTYEIHFAK